MDHARYNTAQALAAGILDRPIPETEVPRDRVIVEVEFPLDGSIDLREALASGELLVVSEYYGIAYAWKDADQYRGTLLQYRKVTEDPTFSTSDELINWFVVLAQRIAG